MNSTRRVDKTCEADPHDGASDKPLDPPNRSLGVSYRLGILALLPMLGTAWLVAGHRTSAESESLAKHRTPTVELTPTELSVQDKVVPAAKTDMPTWMLPFHRALAGDRNPAHGRLVYTRTCRNCHRIDVDGYDVGPRLCCIYLKPDTEILRDILEPSREINPKFRTCVVVTNSGSISTGILDAESETSLTLRKENGLNEIIFRGDVDEIKMSDVSLMPANLREQLKPQDVADLIAYLRQTTTPQEKDQQNRNE